MNTVEAAPPAAPEHASRLSFFRQSGWMLFATTLGGILYWAVHFFARKMSPAEYGLFTTLLQVFNQMAIPAVGLQMIFVQEAALLETEDQRRELAGAARAVFKATFLVWLAAVVLVFVMQKQLLANYKIENPVALWCTVLLGLGSLWKPVLSGIMQGRQNFLWLGNTFMIGAGTRLGLMAVIVLLLGGQAAGAMCAVVIGILADLTVGYWQTHRLWLGGAARFAWTPWLKRVLPLTLGLGTTTFMFTVDMIAVRRFLPEDDTGIYGAAGMIGRALMFLVAPMTAVMFPKIVQSAAKSERTDVLAQALGATALLAGGAALSCTLFPALPIRIVQGSKYLDAAALVPWFTWCVLPLTVSNVLVNNLMARQRYAVVPWLVAVAAAYGLALWLPFGHASKMRVIQTLGVFASLYFLVCLWFTWRGARAARTTSETAAG